MRRATLLRRAIQTKPAVQLLLDHRAVHRPHPDSPAHALALWDNINRGGLADRSRRSRVALDNDRPCAAVLPRSGVHFWGRVAGIDRELHNRQRHAGFCRVVLIEDRSKLLPDCALGCLPFEHLATADSDEENRSFRADDDQFVAERRCQKYCGASDRHGSRRKFGIEAALVRFWVWRGRCPRKICLSTPLAFHLPYSRRQISPVIE